MSFGVISIEGLMWIPGSEPIEGWFLGGYGGWCFDEDEEVRFWMCLEGFVSEFLYNWVVRRVWGRMKGEVRFC